MHTGVARHSRAHILAISVKLGKGLERQQDSELLPTKACDQAIDGGRALNLAGHVDQRLVADIMTLLVVHALEVIEINQQDAEPLLIIVIGREP